MRLLSVVVIDITAALARSAMSRTERPDDFGGTGGGAFSATCCGAGAVFDLAVSAALVSAGLVSAIFVAAADLDASASCGATTGAALAAFEATLAGADAANRSLNMSC